VSSKAFTDTGVPWEKHKSLEKITEALKEVITPTLDYDIGAIAITGQMHSFLFMDATLTPLSPLITWQDESACQADGDGKPHIDTFKAHAQGCSTQDPGLVAAPGYMGPTVYAMVQEGRIPEGTSKIAMLHDWVVSLLCGENLEELTTDATFAHSSGLFLGEAKCWNHELCEKVGIPQQWLPKTVESGTKIAVTGDNPFDLPSGIPVLAGLGDNQASLLGCGADLEDSVFLNVGTGGQVSVITKDYLAIPGIETRVFPENRYLLVGASLCGGRAFAILKDFFQDVGRQVFGLEVDDKAIYDRLEALGEAETTLTCQTTFAGTRTHSDQLASLQGLSESNFTASDLTASVLQGIINEFYQAYQRMGMKRGQLVGSGNGLRRTPALVQKAEQLFGLPLTLPNREEEACLGAALCAAGQL
jgi:sedoheptulokinase